MRKVLAVMFTTLDGVAEVPLYDAEPGADTDEPDPMWVPRMESIDTLILGRRTYEKWVGYWPAKKDDPTASEFQKAFSSFCDRAEKLVVSKTLKKADWTNSRIVSGDLEGEVARLKALPGKDIAIGGGPRVLQSFLERGLVDELVLAMSPSLVGEGKPLFRVISKPDSERDMVPPGTPGRHDFKLIESKALDDGSLYLHYQRAPGKPPG
jgi:dihydrofolate reductase